MYVYVGRVYFILILMDLCCDNFFFFLMIGRPQRSTLFPYTTLFRSLVTAAGYEIQPTINIPSNAIKMTVARDGVVNVTLANQSTQVQVGQLTLHTFINDTGLESMGENLYLETESSGAPTENTPGLNGAGLLYQGYTETSNVNVAEELVNMIQVQRAYEINSKAISASDQMLQRLNQL